MRFKDLLEEYSIEIDDVRWYLSRDLTRRMLSYSEEDMELTRIIWSGKLESELYNMEEKYSESIEEQLESGLIDEVQVREILSEMLAEKRKRG